MPFAERRPISGTRVHERTSNRDHTLFLEGNIFPRRLGGEAELELLNGLNEAGLPVLVMQGPRKRGWYVVRAVSEKHQFIDERGVGRKVGVKIVLESSAPPSGGAALAMITRLFGSV